MVNLGQILNEANKKEKELDVNYVENYNVDLLRGWQRSQLKLLKEFVITPLVSQVRMANASGSAIKSHELGGKITALSRADLITKVGRDDDGQFLWKLNEKRVNKNTLKELLNEMGI